MGARPAVPAPLPQRRDQHDRRERRVDGGRGSARRNPSRASRPRSIATDPTRRSSTTHSTSSCAARGRIWPKPCRSSSRPRGRTIRVSIRRCATSTATARCSASRGTALPPSASRTAGRAEPRSTATGFGRCASRSPTTGSSRSRPRRARCRSPRARASGARVSARAGSSSSIPCAGSCSETSCGASSRGGVRTGAGSRRAP